MSVADVFEQECRDRFAFLADYGFRYTGRRDAATGRGYTIVGFASDAALVSAYFEPSDYYMTVQIGERRRFRGPRWFDFGHLLTLVGEEHPAGRIADLTPDEIRRALDGWAAALARYGGGFLRGDFSIVRGLETEVP